MGVKTTMKKIIKAICVWLCVVGVVFGAIDDFKTASCESSRFFGNI